MLRSILATGVSFGLTALVFANAYFNRQQFYPSVVYITKSNSSMAVIYLQALVLVMLLGKLMSKVFFGRLRTAEFEHLMERSWYAITETCLAFTVFKDDFSPKFVALFSLLLFLKSFHWLAEDRVDYMERSPSISLLFHIRVISLAVLLASVDAMFISHAFNSTITKGASVQLVFGFEYAILLTIVVNTVVKYILNSIDLHSENPWEGKAVCLLYSELILGFIKVLFYVLFIVIMVRIYSLPLFAVRPMYLTMRAFKKAFNDVIMSRRAIHNMNTWYPDATEEELATTDNVCIICREEMNDTTTTKKLPCNHIFHKTCLRSWFQRQQTCPTCRLDVLRSPQLRIGGQRGANQQQQPPAAQPAAAAPPAAGANPAAPAAPAGAGGPPMPPFDPNVFAQLFNLPPPPAPPGGAARNVTAPPAPPPAPPGLPPLPPFPPMAGMPPPPPFGVPPPMPPPNFSGMTDQELRDLEGTERANVEARVRCLRNIQVLLDAAVLEMQQYSSVVSRLNTSGVAAPTTSPPSQPAPAVATASAASAVPPVVKKEKPESGDKPQVEAIKPTEETGAIPKQRPSAAAPKAEVKKEETEDKEAEEIIRKMESPSSENPDEIRRRRLEKLQQNNQQT